jgi:rSAM/selenodomain-associated transferase 1
MTARSGRHLVIFTRQPRLGSGKRRLARDIGRVAALRFQRAMLSLLLRRLGRDRRWTTWLAVTPDRSGPWPARLPVVPQGPGDVGQRMGRVARMLPRGPVVIIGSDIPGITAGDIAGAFKALGHRDAVFGPATDGGYWLVGLRRRPRMLVPFDDVRWSSEHALKDTLANLAGRSVGLLRPLTDIDDGAAFHRLRHWRALHGHHHR